MATFPESPAPVYPLDVTPVWDTLVSITDGGTEQRRQKTLFPKYDVRVNYYGLSAADAQVLWDFYMARRGAFEAFYIYDLALLNNGTAFFHYGQYVGVGDATTAIFDLPGRSTNNRVIYADGSQQSGNYSILTGGGASNADRVSFTTAPTDGAIITCDFSGFLRMRVRFAEDRLSRNLFTSKLYAYGIELKGLGPA